MIGPYFVISLFKNSVDAQSCNYGIYTHEVKVITQIAISKIFDFLSII